MNICSYILYTKSTFFHLCYNKDMNIIDYCKWRGDISMKYDPFNYVDCLTIAQMTYTPLDGLFPEHGVATIGELAEVLLKKKQECMDPNSFVASAPTVLEAMAEGERFRNCKVYNYESILHEDITEQFAALMMDLPDGTTVVSFRGTDDTMIGWNEDLLLSYTETVAQHDALKYLNRNSKLFKKYRVIGHSKGGNLAIYSVVHSDKKIQDRVIQIVSCDGPGLRPDTYSREIFEKLSPKYVKIVPEYDLFGTIYDNARNKIVVKSAASGIMQHSAVNWQIIRNEFETVDDICRTSQLLKQGIQKFLDDTKPQEREIMIRQVFDSMKDAGIKNITDFADGGLPVVIKALKSVSTIDDVAKDTVNKLIKVFTDAYTIELGETVASGTDMIKNKAQELGKNVGDFVSDTVKNVGDMINSKTKK